MKALIAVVCALVFLAPQAASAGSYRASQEKSFSLIGSFAGAFGLGGDYIGHLDKMAGDVVTDSKDQYVNYGEGIKVELGAQYRLMDHLGCQAELGYTWGVPTLKTTHPVDFETETYSKSMFGIKVLAVPKVQVLDLIDIYASFGVGMFFGWMTWERPSSVFNGEYKTNPAFAYCGSIGAEYPVMNEIVLYGEIASEMMNFNLARSRDTDSNNEVVYEQNSTAANLPPPHKIPGSNVALRVGVRFPIF